MTQVTVFENGRKTSKEKLLEALRSVGLNPDTEDRKELLQLCRDNGIQVISDDEASAGAAQAKANEARKAVGYTINISGTKDRKQIPVGVNGRITLIKCDVDVCVKPEILEVLRNAKEDFIEFVQDESTGRVLDVIKRPVLAVPFQLVETHYE